MEQNVVKGSNFTRQIRHCAVAFTLSVALIASAGCERRSATTSQPLPPVSVTVAPATVASVQSVERIPGMIRPAHDSQVEAKVPAKIETLFVNEGDKVKAGQLLIQLDSREMNARLNQALAASKLAEEDAARFATLLPAGAVTKRESSAAQAKAEIATETVAEVRALLEQTRLLAPYDGIVTKRFIQQGDLALPGKPLLRIEGQDLYRFEADVPETLASLISPNSKLVVSISGVETEVSAVVSEISPTSDPNTRTVKIKLDVPPNLSVRTGQFGYVAVPTRLVSTISVPVSAVREHGQLESIFVARGDTATLRLIRTGKLQGNRIEVISGLSEGDTIILESSAPLRDGARITVTP